MSGSYEYKRYMRDGSMKVITAVVRSRSAGKVKKPRGSKTK